MFIKIAAQMLLGAGAVFHATLIGREQFAALPGFGVRLPDLDRKSAQVDPRDLGRIDLLIGQITLADLPGAMAFEDIDPAADGLQTLGDREAVGAGFEDENVLAGGVPRRPGAKGGQGLARDALGNAGAQRIAPLEDRRGEGVGMDVEADGAAGGAECRRRIDGLLR